MLKSYLKVTLKHLLSQRLFSAINVLGLAVGLACTLLIGVFVADELSYDRFFADADRIYRVSRDYHPTELQPVGRSPASLNAPFAPQLEADFPQIEESARLRPIQALVAREGGESYQEAIRFVDPAFVDIFQFEWLAGDPGQALAEPFSLVLTETLARKYFPDEQAFGGTLSLIFESPLPLRVTGIIRDLPANTHLDIQALAPLAALTRTFGDGMLADWRGNTDYHTYIRLTRGADIAELEREFPAFIARHLGSEASQSSGMTVMRLTDIHLRSQRAEEMKPPGKLTNVLAFAIIALCVLLIACINFTNLSTARATQRAREVGMRKAVGARKGQLMRQFLGESVLLAILAMGIALVLVELFLPVFTALTGLSVDLALIRDGSVMPVLVVLTLLTGLVAGSYPALYLSSFPPARVLKGDALLGGGGIGLRQALVVLQFAIAIALVASTAVIHAQMQYARGIDLGLEKARVVVFGNPVAGGLGPQWEAMKRELVAHPEISQATGSHYSPFRHDDNSVPLAPTQAGAAQLIKYMAVDFDFFETYGIALLAGRYFSESRGVDRIVMAQGGQQAEGSLILNEAAARLMGWSPAQAIEQSLWFNEAIRFPVVGVIENSYFESVTTAVKPMVFLIGSPVFTGVLPPLRQAAVKISGRDIEATLAHIDRTWNTFFPEISSNRRFLDEDFEALYQTERQQMRMLSWFTGLAILIACLGLYGLASFNAERRTREIGVRKVMGGSVWSIVLLLTNDFSKLVLLANIIAWPVAYFAMNQWLANFGYRIDLTNLIFIGSGLIALCIAWVTVGGTAAKAASAKPVLALRYE